MASVRKIPDYLVETPIAWKTGSQGQPAADQTLMWESSATKTTSSPTKTPGVLQSNNLFLNSHPTPSSIKTLFSVWNKSSMTTSSSKSATAIGTQQPIYPLPNIWNPKDKCQYLSLSKGNLRLTYTGSGKSDVDAASVRANNPIPPQCGIFYYEVDIVSKGRDGQVNLRCIEHSRYIGIGFCTQTVNLNRLPGWEKNSWGYHGDDGNSFCSSGPGKSYGPTFTTGDVVGCGINYLNMSAFFTKNGVQLGTAFKDLKGSFYPSVGLRTPGEIVETNFGHKRFKFDIEQYVKEERNKLIENIYALPIPQNLIVTSSAPTQVEPAAAKKEEESTAVTTSKENVAENMDVEKRSSASISTIRKCDINDLVLSYLIHNDYVETTRRFYLDAIAPRKLLVSGEQKDLEKLSVEEVLEEIGSMKGSNAQGMKARRAIRDSILRGDIDAAIHYTNNHFPGLLSEQKDILFQLECRKFAEMVIQLSPKPSAEAMDIDESPTHNSTHGGLVGGKGKQKDAHESAWSSLLSFGQLLQEKYGSDGRQNVQTSLLNIFSLIAYVDPYQSPHAELLNESGREAVADTLNSAILGKLFVFILTLANQNENPISSIEAIYRQTTTVTQRMVKDGIGSASYAQIGHVTQGIFS